MKNTFETRNYRIVVHKILIGMRVKKGVDIFFDPIRVEHKYYEFVSNDLSKTYYGYLIGYDAPITKEEDLEIIIEKLLKLNP